MESPSEPVDLALAITQWDAYVQAFVKAGWTIVECAPADDCPDAVFIEDAVVVFGDQAVVCRPGAPSRRAEIEAIPALFSSLGLDVLRLDQGTLDGGDVLKVGRIAYVGLSERSSASAIARLGELLGDDEWTVRSVAMKDVLHLKSAITALPDGEIIGLGACVDTQVTGAVREMPEPEGAHVVELGERHLLVSSAAPDTVRELRDEGYTVSTVDISEFEKLDGCVTCLSVRIR